MKEQADVGETLLAIQKALREMVKVREKHQALLDDALYTVAEGRCDPLITFYANLALERIFNNSDVTLANSLYQELVEDDWDA